MPLKVGLTYDLESDYPVNPETPPDANSEFDSVRTILAVKKGIKDNGYELADLGNFENLLNIRKNIREKVDIIFNIAEGIKGRNREAQIPLLLEYLNIPFTGSDALTMSLTLDKVVTKQILTAQNIPTPKYFSYPDDRINHKDLKFPMIVKPRWEGSSMGINKDSVVLNVQKLQERAKYISKTYKQPALVEEFISGSEYTVPIVGNNPPQALIPMKVMINGYEMENRVYDNSYIRSDNVAYVPLTKKDLLFQKLTDLSIKTFKCVDCLDVGRVDFRVNSKGKIFVLELNPLPAFNPGDALVISAHAAGLNFAGLIRKIIESAILRYPGRFFESGKERRR